MGEKLFFIGRLVRASHRHYVALRDVVRGTTTAESVAITPTKNSKEDFFVRSVLAVFQQRAIAMDEAIRSTQTKINEILIEIENLERLQKTPAILQKIGPRQTEVKSLEGALKERIREKEAARSLSEYELRQQYREIMSIPRLVALSVFEHRIEFRTDVLFGRDHKRRWRRVGPFECSFNVLPPISRSMRWVNLDGDRMVPASKTRYHGPPNICVHTAFSNVGSVSCMGTGVEVVTKATDTLDYPALVKFMIRYPECAGDTKHNVMELWPEVSPGEVPLWYIEQFGK